MIKKRFLILAAAAIAVIAVVLASSFYPFQTSADNIGGKYNAVVTKWTDHTQLTYVDETGQHVSNYFEDKMKPGLNWIKRSTPENATFLCWWDYGHMVKAVGERNVIVRNPSQNITASIADPSTIKEFDSNEKIFDVASALATSNASETMQIMAKYNATYILVVPKDLANSAWFFKTAGLNYTDYLASQGTGLVFTDLGRNTMIARLLDNRDTVFTLVYHDDQMKIFKVPDA